MERIGQHHKAGTRRHKHLPRSQVATALKPSPSNESSNKKTKIAMSSPPVNNQFMKTLPPPLYMYLMKKQPPPLLFMNPMMRKQMPMSVTPEGVLSLFPFQMQIQQEPSQQLPPPSSLQQVPNHIDRDMFLFNRQSVDYC
jgi:hypothetical protein